MRSSTWPIGRSGTEPHPLTSWILLMVRMHPQLVTLIVLGTVMRIVTMAAFRPALLFHADAYTYLRIAESLEPSEYRPVLYSFLLKLAYPFHSLVPVVLVQHLAGVAMGIAVYALLRRLGVGALGGAIGAAPLFLDAYQLNIEHNILSETLFQGLVLGALCLVSIPKDPPGWAVAAAGGLIGLAGITRVVGIVVFLPLLVYLLWRKVDLVKVVWCVAAGLLPLVVYAFWFLGETGVFGITSRGNLILYGRVSPFADCRNADLPKYQRGLCDVRPPAKRPGTEFYVWRTANSYSPLQRLVLPPGKNEEEVLGDFAHRIILAQPLDYARVVIGDIAHYLAPGHWEEPRDAQSEPFIFTPRFDYGPKDPDLVRELTKTGDNMPKVIVENRGSPEPSALFGDRPPPKYEVNKSLAQFMSAYQTVVYAWGPLLGIAILLGTAGSILRPAGGRKRSVRRECFLFTAAGVLVVLVPAATAVFDYRYLMPAVPLLSTGGVLGAHAVILRVREARAVPRPSSS